MLILPSYDLSLSIILPLYGSQMQCLDNYAEACILVYNRQFLLSPLPFQLCGVLVISVVLRYHGEWREGDYACRLSAQAIVKHQLWARQSSGC